MDKITKEIILKFLPLAILYLLIMVMFLAKSEFEFIITLTASIPFTIYILNTNSKIEKILRYILYVFGLGLSIYLITLLQGDYRWFLFCLRKYFNETVWSTLKWNQFFVYDLKYLIYIGIIVLAIKNKKA